MINKHNDIIPKNILIVQAAQFLDPIYGADVNESLTDSDCEVISADIKSTIMFC